MSKQQLNPHEIPETKQTQMRQFLQKYKLKNLTYSQLTQIYKKNAMTPYFKTTMYAAIILVFVPSITNIYYMFRPNSMFSKIFPLAVPVICLAQYFAALRYDLQNFCFKQTDDSKILRQKYQVLTNFQLSNKTFKNLQEQIKQFKQQKQQTTISKQETILSKQEIKQPKK